MFTFRQTAPILTRVSSRFRPLAVKAFAASISTTSPFVGSITKSAVTQNGKNLVSTGTMRAMSSLKDSYNHILAEKRLPDSSACGGGVGLITLHRPKALNALCDALFEDLIHAVHAFEEDEDVGCVVVTGSPKAFAAGKCNGKRHIYFILHDSVE